MSKNYLLKKMLVLAIIVLFIGTVVIPSIGSISNQLRNKKTSTETVSFNPFKEGWKYRKQITIDHTQVAEDFFNFPVLVSIVDNDLRDKAQVDGDDVLFMDNTGVANQIYHEIEYYYSSSGKLIAWVNLPYVSQNVDTIFYIYYGNPKCNNQENIEGTWSSDYVMVHHLQETSGTHYDSTSNNHDSLIVHVTDQDATGKIAGADDFEEATGNNRILITDSPDWDFGTKSVTISMWVKMESRRHISFIHHPTKGWHINYYYDDSKLKYNFNNLHTVVEFEWSFSIGTWYYLTYTRTGDTHTWYVDGSTRASKIVSGSPDNTNDEVWIGGNPTGNYLMDGIIDEVRILNVGRSKQWILTEFNNQNDPSCFLSFGPEETKQKAYNYLVLQWFFERFPILQKIFCYIL